jgi:acyl-CoA thioesterase
MTTDTRKTAKAIRDYLYALDTVARDLGIRLVDVQPGFARCDMPVLDRMVNFNGTVHGGYIFTLADTAFSYACSAKNQQNVAHSCDITYTAPGHADEILSAEAREMHRAGRTAVYDVTVTGGDGRTVALFRGIARLNEQAILSTADDPNSGETQK